MAAAVRGLSPVIHYRTDSHVAQLLQSLFHPSFDDVLQVDDSEQPSAVGNRQRRATGAGNPIGSLAEFG
jgi:hypothetical protein